MRFQFIALVCLLGWNQSLTAQLKAGQAKDLFGDPLPAGALARIGTLRWNTGNAFELDYSPDGKRLAVRCGDRSFQVYDAANGRELRRFAASYRVDADYYYWDWMKENTPAIANAMPKFPPRDSIRLPCTSGDRHFSVEPNKKVRVVHTKTDEEIGQFGTVVFPTMAVFSPDGTILAIADGSDFSVHFFDVRRGNLLGVGKGHKHHLGDLKFLPDGKSLVTWAGDLTVRCWDATNGKERWAFRGEGAKTHSISICCSPDGKTIAVAGWNGHIYQFDAVTGRERETTLAARTAHNHDIHALIVHPDGKRLFIGSNAGTREYDAANGRELRGLTGRSRHVFSTDWKQIEFESTPALRCCSADGKMLAFSGEKGLYLMHLEDVKPALQEFKGAGMTYWARFSPDGRTLASCDGSIKLWDTTLKNRIRVMSLPSVKNEMPFGQDEISSRLMDVSPDGRTLATHGSRTSDAFQLWNLNPGERHGCFGSLERPVHVNFTCDVGFGFAGRFHQAAISKCGRFFFSFLGDQLRTWDIAARAERAVVHVENCDILTVEFSSDGRWLALGGRDRLIRIVDVLLGKEVHQFQGHQGVVSYLAFSANGEWLASGAEDATVLIWDFREIKKNKPSKQIQLTANELDAHWRELGQRRSDRLPAAIRSLVSAGDQSVAYLLKATSQKSHYDVEAIPKLLRDLDSGVFATRENAMHKLEGLGDLAMPALRQARKQELPIEVIRRIDSLLEKSHEPRPDVLRAIRAVEVLEKIGTDDAFRVLWKLSEGRADARLTQEARSALERQGKNAKQVRSKS